MSSQTLIPITEFDIEEELTSDDQAHALPFCVKHKGLEYFPVPGTIVQAICGKLIRIKAFLSRTNKKCIKCASWQGAVFHCYYCGKEIIG